MKPARVEPPETVARRASNDDAMSPAPMPPRPPESEARSWVFFAVAVLLSLVGHVVTLVQLPDRPPAWVMEKPLDVEIKVIEPPKPPPEPEKPPEPEPPKPKIKPPPVKVETPKPPEEAPPPPLEEPPAEPPKPVPLIVGLSLSNTNEGGSFAAPVGNTAYGKTAKTAVDPNAVQAYKAPKYVPPGGADTDPVAIGEVKVPYPEQARKAEVEGSVRMKVTVDFEGNVTDVVVMSGPGYGLNEAAAAAMRKFRFKPASKGGEPVGTTFPYTYTFLLD